MSLCGLMLWVVGMCDMVMCLGCGLGLWMLSQKVGLVLVLGLDVLKVMLVGGGR